MPDVKAPLTYDYQQAAELLGISVRFLERAVASGEIMHNRFGRRVRFMPRHLEQYLEHTEQPLLHRPKPRL